MEAQGFYDIYGICHVPIWQRAWFYWTNVLILCLAVCLVIGYLVMLYRRRLKRIQMPYWQKMINELQELQQQKLSTREQSSRLYTYLTQVLKEYLHQRYHYDLIGKTDAETLIILEKSRFDRTKLEHLKTIFEG